MLLDTLIISSPTFLAFKPSGPNLGAKVEAGPASPPKTLTLKILIYVGSIFGGILRSISCLFMMGDINCLRNEE